MSTFVHNEPTTLVVLQELGVPERFLASANRTVTASVEIISALPNAFGAICLNAVGLQSFLANDPLWNYLKVFLSPKWHQPLVTNDVPHLAGSSIDELFRHQPAIKEQGYAHINKWCIQALKDIKVLNVGEMEGTHLHKLESEEIKFKRVDSQVCLMMEVVVRFLEGLFQNVAHAKALAGMDCLPILLEMYTLPTLPYDFVVSPATLSFGYVLRSMLEASHVETIAALKSTFVKLINTVNPLLQKSGDLLDCLELTNAQVNIAERDILLKQLIFVKAFVKLFNDLFCTHWLSSLRSITGITALFEGNELLLQIVQLGRDIAQFTLKAKNHLPLKWIEDFEVPFDPKDRTVMEEAGIKKEILDDVNLLNISKWNLNWCAIPILDLPADIHSTIVNLEKVICSRKSSEHGLNQSLDGLVRQYANLMKNLLECDHVVKLKYGVDLVCALLIESRHGSKSIQTIVLYYFSEFGGLELMTKKLQYLVSDPVAISTLTAQGIVENILSVLAAVINDKRFHDSVYTATLVGRQRNKNHPEYFDSHMFLVRMRTLILKSVLDIYHHENFTKLTPSICNLVLKCIITVYSAAGEKPRDVATIIRNATLDGLQASIFSLATAAPRPVADPNKITILVDMGFPESAARTALENCSNNVSRAADYLLNHPGVVATARDSAESGQSNLAAEVFEGENDEDDESGESENDSFSEDEEDDDSQEGSVSGVEENVAEGEATVAKARDETISTLNQLRETSAPNLVPRALQILSQVNDSVILIIKELLSFVAKDTIISSVVEPLFVLIKGDSGQMVSSITLFSMLLMDPAIQTSILKSPAFDTNWFFSLLGKANKVEKWISPLLLVFEAILTIKDEESEPLAIENGKPITVKKRQKESRVSLDSMLVLNSELIRVLGFNDIDTISLTSILRILVIITQKHEVAETFMENGGIKLLFQPELIARFPFQHAIVMMILRHICESPATLKILMGSEINYFLSYPRSRSIEISNFIKGTTFIMLRDLETFKEILVDCADLADFNPGSLHYLAIKSEENQENTITDGPLESVASAKLVEYLAVEIFQTKSTPVPVEPSDKAKLHLARTAQLQCLSELIVVFPRCKIDLIAFTNKKNSKSGQVKATPKNSFLNFLLTEILPKESAVYSGASEVSKYSLKESSWTMGLITSLCTIREKHINKKYYGELQLVQSCVLDSIHRNLKDTVSSEDIRLSNLEAYADLCTRILIVQQQINTREKMNDKTAYFHLAKLMIDKGFAELFTTAIGKLDTAAPGTKNIVKILLKPINCLTKAAIGLGREVDSSSKTPRKSIANFENAFNEVQDDVFMEERPEITDLYRNSALGILEPASAETSSEESDSQMDYDSFDEDDDEDGSEEVFQF